MTDTTEAEKITRFDLRKRRTRQQLRDAAVALVLERGYDAVSIQDITDRADVGRGTFYLHFRDKQEVIAVAIQDAFEVLALHSMAPLAELPLEQRDYLSFIAFFKYVVGQSGLFRAVMLSSETAGLVEYIASYTLKQAFSRLAEQNIFPDVPQEIAAQFMTGALMRVVRWWTREGQSYSPEQMGELFYRLLHHQPPPLLSFDS
jgi:AcrR family transcriptional regulator